MVFHYIAGQYEFLGCVKSIGATFKVDDYWGPTQWCYTVVLTDSTVAWSDDRGFTLVCPD
jgi:hypothetical protein